MLLLAAVVLPASSASATTLPSDFTTSCPTESPDGSYGGARICSGVVPSFDEAKLDVDLTQPMHDTGTSHPLIVMLHGFGNDKHEWESTTDEGDGADKYHWNNHWFAKHGYYVLSYTARGFSDDGAEQDERAADADDPSGSEDPAAPRLHPAEEPRLRDPRHAVARGADRRHLPGRRPRPDRGHRRLLRRHRELAPGEPGRPGPSRTSRTARCRS